MSEEYYDSEEWSEVRGRALEEWDGVCEHCGEETSSPHVHHKFGLSKDEFEILCPECHADHHGDPDIADCRSHAHNRRKH